MFITYKITCTITGKYYIGSHKTDNIDDGYMGSGRLIRKSIEEYGVENHTKEILGVFSTREESLELEHTLVKEGKSTTNDSILNISNGGFSFDYINDNLEFDRAEFGRRASHQYIVDLRKNNIIEYNKNPKLCLFCNKPLPYDKRTNTFCNQSCSASYNNIKRSSKNPNGTITLVCIQCGKEFTVPFSYYRKKFCSARCINDYKKEHREMTEKRKIILQDLPIIIERHKTESYRKIASDYGVSGTLIKDAVKGRLSK